MKYVLITPAHNEERFITKTLDSMVAQTLLPERWIIVDDGSTDRTAEIVGELCETLSLDRVDPASATLGSKFCRQSSRVQCRLGAGSSRLSST